MPLDERETLRPSRAVGGVVAQKIVGCVEGVVRAGGPPRRRVEEGAPEVEVAMAPVTSVKSS
jgi:hypothetical protein